MTHYIHRPTPESGETDDRFREAPCEGMIQIWEMRCRWAWIDGDNVMHGEIWRIPGSDAPSADLLALAKATREAV